MFIALAVMAAARQQIANEAAPVLGLRSRLPPDAVSAIAEFLGVDDCDMKWVAPFGGDWSYLVRESEYGASAEQWSFDGWVLDDQSLVQLVREFGIPWVQERP